MALYRFKTEKITVSTAGTAVPLASSSKLVASLVVDALATNTLNIYLGDSTVSSTTGLVMKPEKAVDIELQNDVNGKLMEIDLADMYVDADTNGNAVIIGYLERA